MEVCSQKESGGWNAKSQVDGKPIEGVRWHLELRWVATPWPGVTLSAIGSLVLFSKCDNLGFRSTSWSNDFVSLLEATLDFVGHVCFKQSPVDDDDGHANCDPKSAEYYPQTEQTASPIHRTVILAFSPISTSRRTLEATTIC
jgi:hypothetical protein